MKTLLLRTTTLFLLTLHLSVFAQAPDLGSASDFALFSSVGAFTNVGACKPFLFFATRASLNCSSSSALYQ